MPGLATSSEAPAPPTVPADLVELDVLAPEEVGGLQVTSPGSTNDTVDPARLLDDGILRFTVLGDEQAAGWGPGVSARLQARIRSEVPGAENLVVHSKIISRRSWTAAHVRGFLDAGGWGNLAPEVLVVAVGWHDGLPGVPLPAWAASQLADDEELPRLDNEAGFYASSVSGAAATLAPAQHLAMLRGLASDPRRPEGLVLFLQQPVQPPEGEKNLVASTGAVALPSIVTLPALEALEAESSRVFAPGSALRLSKEGTEAVAGVVSEAVLARLFPGSASGAPGSRATRD